MLVLFAHIYQALVKIRNKAWSYYWRQSAWVITCIWHRSTESTGAKETKTHVKLLSKHPSFFPPKQAWYKQREELQTSSSSFLCLNYLYIFFLSVLIMLYREVKERRPSLSFKVSLTYNRGNRDETACVFVIVLNHSGWSCFIYLTVRP